MRLHEEIDGFFRTHGIEPDGAVVAVPVVARSPEEAMIQHARLKDYAGSVIFVVEDRWHTQRGALESRLLAHYHVFRQVYARNCVVRRIDKPAAEAFLAAAHSYGDASCKYRYGLFTLRSTGEKGPGSIGPGTLVAVSEFSSARNWKKGDRTVRSCEWTRYASLPGVRVVGGMSKMLKHFIGEVHPDDIMSYSDLEWSDGGAYRQLGFELESVKSPVLFRIDPVTWQRVPVRYDSGSPAPEATNKGSLWFMNWGSLKYRLKIVDYEP